MTKELYPRKNNRQENFAMKTSTKTTFSEEISYITMCLKESERILRNNAAEWIRGYIMRHHEVSHGTSTSEEKA